MLQISIINFKVQISDMKKYILSVAFFLMIAGVAGAQMTKKAAGDIPATAAIKITLASPLKDAEVSKTAVEILNTTSTDKTTGTMPIKRKTHSKFNSVPTSK
jgi:hypothetical protein